MTAAKRSACILLVEDNPDDAELARLACEELGRDIQLHHVSNGAQCMAFLKRQGHYADAPTPDLVLLDINMPVMNGFEVLGQINADPSLHHLTVIVLTTSASEQDVLRMCRLRCNAYIVKPTRFSEFVAVLRGLLEFWLDVARLPHVDTESHRETLRKLLGSRSA